MRVFWWQGGLHAQPESDVETEALLVLMHDLKIGRPVDGLTDHPVVGAASVDDLGGDDQLGGHHVGQERP